MWPKLATKSDLISGFYCKLIYDYCLIQFMYIFLVCPIWLPVFLIFYNEPELGVGIDPGMALTPLPSSIGRGLNPRPYDREPSALPLDHGFRLIQFMYMH
jgi:hypothetical protein